MQVPDVTLRVNKPELIAGLTLRQRALFGPIFQLEQLVFFRARVTIGLACRTGVIFLRFSGERGKARGEREARDTRDGRPLI